MRIQNPQKRHRKHSRPVGVIDQHFDALTKHKTVKYQTHIDGGVEADAIVRGDVTRYLARFTELEVEGNVIDKLFKYRNKIGAHHDKRYFFDPTKFPKFRLINQDVDALIVDVKMIFKHCWLAFYGGNLKMEFTNANDVERLLERLEKLGVGKGGNVAAQSRRNLIKVYARRFS